MGKTLAQLMPAYISIAQVRNTVVKTQIPHIIHCPVIYAISFSYQNIFTAKKLAVMTLVKKNKKVVCKINNHLFSFSA